MSELTDCNDYATIQDMLTVNEVAQLAGVTGGRIRQLIIAGRLVCVKRGGAWFIDRESAGAWINSDRTPGPKKQAATNAKG